MRSFWMPASKQASNRLADNTAGGCGLKAKRTACTSNSRRLEAKKLMDKTLIYDWLAQGHPDEKSASVDALLQSLHVTLFLAMLYRGEGWRRHLEN